MCAADAVTELRKRSSPETDHEYMAWRGHEQQKRHHLAGISGNQGVRIIQVHGALDRANGKEQVSRSAVVNHEWTAERPLAQALELLVSEALRRLDEPQGSGLEHKRARQFDELWLVIITRVIAHLLKLSSQLCVRGGVRCKSRTATRITIHAISNINDWLHFGPVQSTRRPP